MVKHKDAIKALRKYYEELVRLNPHALALHGMNIAIGVLHADNMRLEEMLQGGHEDE